MASRSSRTVRLEADTTDMSTASYVVSGFGRTVTMAAAVASLVAPLAAQQPERTRTEALAKRAGERLVALQHEADRLAADEGSLLNQLRKLEIDRELKGTELKQA